MEFRAGFVNIIGNANVGKSTLINALTGENLCIVTPKAQTTRHRITGILNGNDFQIVFSDTPGIVKPKYKLHESMLKTVDIAMRDADIIIYMVEINEDPAQHVSFLKSLKRDIPVILLLNKTDMVKSEEAQIAEKQWRETGVSDEIYPVSALQGSNLNEVLNAILAKLPVHPMYYPDGELTDRNERFFVSEIIRKSVLNNYRKEIPYSVEVVIDSFKESEKIINIATVIFVIRESQKGILIGHGGKAIKKTMTEARQEMEEFLGKKVFVDTTIKVKKDWRNDSSMLSTFGYH